MSSFFTIPGTQKKRKRQIAPDGPKKRLAVIKAGSKTAHSNAKSTRPAEKKPKATERDESISGSDLDDEASVQSVEPDSDAEQGSDSDGEVETAAEKRLRLAERYLENVKQQVDTVGFDAADIDRDLIAKRLQEDVAEAKGKVYRSLVQELAFNEASHIFFRADSKAVTSVTICAPYVYLTTKDLIIQKWKVQDLPQDQYPQKSKKKKKKKKQKKQAPPRKRPELVSWVRGNYGKRGDKDYKRHTQHILTSAVSSDGKFLVTGGADRRMIVYDAATLHTLKVFTHHRDAVTGVTFRRGTNQLYSCSRDRTVKVWSLNELAYVETLFGHGDEVVDIDALGQEKCISVGARDRTARLWKVADETQLVYRGGAAETKPRLGEEPKAAPPEGSMDRVAMIDDDLFVTGGDNGTIALWNVQKKKPLSVVVAAHGMEDPLDPTQASAEKKPSSKAVPPQIPRWITALRTVPYSDVVLSGSWDGTIRVWQLSEDKKQLLPAGVLGGPPDANADQPPNGELTNGHQQVPWRIPGLINDIAVFERGEKGKDGLCVVAAVSKEHKFGRWIAPSNAKNGGVIFEIPRVQHRLAVNQEDGEAGSADPGEDG